MLTRPRVLTDRPCAIYAALNRAGEIIYVGQAVDPERRWREHEGDKPWAYEVAEWRLLEWLPTVVAACEREDFLILTLRTRWNIKGSPVADEVRARYLSMFGYVPEGKPHSHAQTLAWPLRFLLWLGKALLIVTYLLVTGVVKLAWAVLWFFLRSLLGGRRRRRRRR